jgi:hypothetical protein
VLRLDRESRPPPRAGERQRDRFLWTRRRRVAHGRISAQAVFQSRLCVEREAAANAAEAQGIRAVNLRIGLVLGRRRNLCATRAARQIRPGREDRRRAAVDVLDHIVDCCIIELAIDDTRPARSDQRRGARARTPGRISARAGAGPPAVFHAHPAGAAPRARRNGGVVSPGTARRAAAC